MIASVALFFAVFLLFLHLSQTQRAKNFPPGPRPIPILGNLLEFKPENPLDDLKRLAKRYGNVYSLFIGTRPVVVINGLEAIKEALVKKAADFSGRPKNMLVNHAVVIKDDAPGVILSDYNASWKEHRRFGLMTLRNFGLGKQSMEKRITAEINHVKMLLEQSIGKTMNPRVVFHNAASNIICQILFGQRFNYDDDYLKFFVGFFMEVSKIANGPWAMIYDSVPMIRKLPLPFQRLFKLCNAAYCKRSEVLAERRKNRVPNKPRHFIDCYLDELDKRGNDGSTFSEDQLSALIFDLHFAGTDTTSNTLLVAFLYLMNYPEIQERCQQEIDKVLGEKDEPSFEDRNKMPYTQAVLHEIQRKADTVPLSVFHCVTNNTDLMGYSIPKGTVVIPNLSSVLSEEGQWKFPHGFHPENFLDEKGEFVKPEAFLPFSIGPRVCLGEGLARMELFLFVVSLLRRYKFIWPKESGEPDYSLIFGGTQIPKSYSMKVEFRKPAKAN